MNQCDGCRAGKPLVKLVNNEFVEAPDGDCHVMGSLAPGEYPDLMGCERNRYECEACGAPLVTAEATGERACSNTSCPTVTGASSTCSCDQRGRNISCARCRP